MFYIVLFYRKKKKIEKLLAHLWYVISYQGVYQSVTGRCVKIHTFPSQKKKNRINIRKIDLPKIIAHCAKVDGVLRSIQFTSQLWASVDLIHSLNAHRTFQNQSLITNFTITISITLLLPC